MYVNDCRVGFVSGVTLGAVVSTGYHGSGLSFGALEDYVRPSYFTVYVCYET